MFEADASATYGVVYSDKSTGVSGEEPKPETDTVVSIDKSDEAPDVELSDSKDTLINKVMSEELKKKAEGKNVKINLSVEKMSKLSDVETEVIEKTITSVQKVGLLLNINLSVDIEGDKINVSDTPDAIRLSIDVPQELVNSDSNIERTYSVLRIHNGKVDVLKAVYNNNTNKITFETDGFSTYVLVYEDVVKTPEPENPTVENPAPETPSAEAPATDVPGETEIKDTDKSVKTGDKSPIAALITMLGLSGLGIFASTKKKRV